MDYILTDEKDERFLRLVDELDHLYFERVGEELSRYDSYNEFDKPHVVMLCMDMDNPVACASYRVCSEDTVEFKRVFVKEDYRNKGIAYSLVKKLEDLAVEDNFRYSYIVTGKTNSAAIGLYEKLNYHSVDKFGQFKDDDIVVCMKKEF